MIKEIWKDIQGYEGLYQVSNKGRVKSLSHKKSTWKGGEYMTMEKILIPQNARGYRRVNLCKVKNIKLHSVHRLVAFAFIENTFKKPHINHKSGRRDENNVENLEWVTNSENAKHAIDILNKGTCGEKCHFSVLKESQVLEIIKLYDLKKYTLTQIATKFNVSLTTIWFIGKRKHWKHLKIA